MNLPNKLTLLRVCLIPVIIILAMIPALKAITLFSGVTLSDLLVLVVFVIASFTDFLDGYIARKYNLVTDFGKFMDPLADKLLVFSAFIILMEMGRIPGWIVMVIIAREFLVMGIRVLAAGNQVVIAASMLGKLKTNSQMLVVIVLLLNNYPFSLIAGLNYGEGQNIVGTVLLYLAAILTLVSGIDYFIKNKDVILKTK
ncbi:MAG: CDP-diacylglycerol--glycerol-3-phosphate 3-phosphatidyltransferase [Bacilli bacterium]|nr:CDP-diacylglycerol--glycerol-3-phosphate 3-phosphatidyltransferase [Bacilli bacterium]